MAIQLHLKIYVTRIKASILYMMPKFLGAINHDSMLNIGCECGMSLIAPEHGIVF